MSTYNVWRFDVGNWVKNLDACDKGIQDPAHPVPLTYPEARKVVEYFRAHYSSPEEQKQYQVRELLLEDGVSPGEVVGYNVWVLDDIGAERWTRNQWQTVDDPKPLTYQEAQQWASEIASEFSATIMEIGSDLAPDEAIPPPEYTVVIPPEATPAPATPAPPKDPTIDFDAYNGFTGSRVYGMRQLHQDVEPEIDPYTGLRRGS